MPHIALMAVQASIDLEDWKEKAKSQELETRTRAGTETESKEDCQYFQMIL